MVFTRGDVQVSPRQTAFARYAWQDSDFTCEGCGGRNAVFSGNGIQQKRYSWVGGHTWVLSPRVLNELRVQVTNVHFRSHPPGVRAQEKLFDNSPARTEPLTRVFNFPSLVWGTSANAYSLQLQRQVRNDMSITAGKHTWKVGGGYLHIPIDGDVRENIGAWTFTFDQPFDPTNTAIMANLQGARLFTATIRNFRRYVPNVYWVGFSQELSSTLGIHVDGVYNKMTKIPLAVDINPRSGLRTGPRPVPQFARIDQTQSIGELIYKALMVRLDKRFDHRYLFLLSYTLAKGDSNLASPGTSSRITQAEDAALDWGPAANDRRHVLVASGSVLLPYGVMLGGVWTLRSTLPFSAIAGTDLNGDALVTDYVPGTTRTIGTRDNARMLEAVNTWRTANGLGPISESQIDANEFHCLDLRVSKSFPLRGNQRLELIGQVFNVFGTDNLDAAGWSTNALSDSFGRILQALNRQQAEMAIRLVW
jgi:hypothetical protein